MSRNKDIIRDAIFYATLAELGNRAISRVPQKVKTDKEETIISKKLLESLVYASLKRAINSKGDI